MVTSPTLDGRTGLYYGNQIAGYGVHKFEEASTSVESQDGDEGRKLWELSSKLVGLQAY
jgi:hypothetical protein